MSNVKAWLHGLGVAAIGGAASTLAAYLAEPKDFNFSHAGLIALGKIALAGATIPSLAYLKQSPLPQEAENTAGVAGPKEEIPDEQKHSQRNR